MYKQKVEFLSQYLIKMKSSSKIQTLLLFLAIIAISNQRVNFEYSYEDFEVQFGRTYVGNERLLHKEYFEKNYAEFLKARQNNPDLQVNQFLDWSDEQKKGFFSYKPHPQQATQYPPLRATGVAPPDTLDYRALGKVSPIKNQGSCGCCWAFSSTAAFESQLLFRQNKLYDLSQQYLVQCETNSFGCEGGYTRYALSLLNETGAPLQTIFPYQQTKPYYSTISGNTMCTNSSGYVKLATPASKIQFVSTMTEDQIKAQLASYGPISIGVKGSWQSFMYAPSTGFINDCPSDAAIDHSILLVGYTATHWIVKNSWGTIWGDQGFGYINRTSDCGLKRYMVLFEVPSVPVPTNVKVNITIDMSDSKRNGWQGWVLGLKQGSIIVANFTLASGLSSGKKTVQIDAQLNTQVMVMSTGTSTASKQIGFKLSFTNGGSVIYSKSAGSVFYSTTIFTTFCPSTSCTMATVNTIPVSLQLTDTYGDGNQGNSILLSSASGTIGSFGEQFTEGRESQIFTLSLKTNQKITIRPKAVGSYRQEMGYKLVSLIDGKIIEQFKAGKVFPPDAILSEFTIKETATSTGFIVETTTDENTGNIEQPQVGTAQNINLSPEDTNTNLNKLQIGLISSTCVLAVICLGLVTALVIKNRANKLQGAKQDMENVGSATSLHKEGACIGKQTMEGIK